MKKLNYQTLMALSLMSLPMSAQALDIRMEFSKLPSHDSRKVCVKVMNVDPDSVSGSISFRIGGSSIAESVQTPLLSDGNEVEVCKTISPRVNMDEKYGKAIVTFKDQSDQVMEEEYKYFSTLKPEKLSKLALETRQKAISGHLDEGEVIVGIKTSKLYFSVAGLLFKDMNLMASNVAHAGENTFYRMNKGSSMISLSVCGAVLLMEPATKEWSVPKNLDPDTLVEVVVMDSEGHSLDAQFYDHQVYHNYEHCNVFRF